MTMNDHIAVRMEMIRNGFLHGRATASKINDLNELIRILNEDATEYRSVAFEGASMEIALKGFSEQSMDAWKTYLNLTKSNATQIFVGLGWAIAQEKVTDLLFSNDLDQTMMFRAWDGCGYYDTFFRQRHVIKGQKRLEYISEINFPEYDQGIGRGLWYVVKGDVVKLKEFIESFDSSRHASLWRGAAIACSYVGGFEESLLKQFSSLAGEHAIQLGIGTTFVAKSRIQAGTVTPEMELACKIWCNKTAKEANELLVIAERNPDYSFLKLIAVLKKELK